MIPLKTSSVSAQFHRVQPNQDTTTNLLSIEYKLSQSPTESGHNYKSPLYRVQTVPESNRIRTQLQISSLSSINSPRVQPNQDTTTNLLSIEYKLSQSPTESGHNYKSPLYRVQTLPESNRIRTQIQTFCQCTITKSNRIRTRLHSRFKFQSLPATHWLPIITFGGGKKPPQIKQINQSVSGATAVYGDRSERLC